MEMNEDTYMKQKDGWFRLGCQMRIRQTMFKKRYEPITEYRERNRGYPKLCPDRVDLQMCDCESNRDNY